MMGYPVFVAIKPPLSLAKHVLRQAKEATTPLGDRFRLRWHIPEDCHVTIGYLPKVDPALLHPVVHTLKKAIQGAPFKLTSGLFMPFGHAFTLGVSPKAPIELLFDRLDQALKALKYPNTPKFDHRHPLNPHMTLGRWGSKTPCGLNEISRLKEAWENQIDAFSFEVNAVHILESRPTNTGGRYTGLEKSTLNGTKPGLES